MDFEYVDNTQHEDVQNNAGEQQFFDYIKHASDMVLSPLNKGLQVAASPFNSPEKIQNIVDASGMPVRGIRGLGVLATGGTIQRASEATQPGFKPQTAGEYASDIGADLTDLRGMLVGQVLGAGLKAGSLAVKSMMPTVARLLSATSGINKAALTAVMDNPEVVADALPLSEAKTALKAAQKAAGLTAQEVRELALKPDLSTKTYLDIMEKIEAGKDVTVKELLKAKQAGWKLAQANYSVSGQIAEDISTKVDPLLEKASPEVANAYQQYHLSKLKNVFNEVLPQTKKGDVSFVKSAIGVGAGMQGVTGGLWSALMSPALAGTLAKVVGGTVTGLEALGESQAAKLGMGAIAARQINKGQ